MLLQHARELKDLRREIAEARPARVELTVAALYERFAAAYAESTSWRTIRDRLRPVLARLGDRPAAELRPRDWHEYRAARRQDRTPRGEPFADLTINFELQWLKRLLSWSVDTELLALNPLAGVKGTKTRRQRETAPDEGGIQALLAEADDVRRAIVLCAADGGLRRNEIRLLHWEWVDMETGRVRLPAWATKSKRPRDTVLTERALDALRQLPQALRSPYVFTNSATGRPFDRATLSRWVRRVVDEAGVEGAPGDGRVRLHDLRHSAASLWSRRGVRESVISRMLGHRSLDQTGVYIQPADEDLTDVREKMERGILRDLDRRRGPQRAAAPDNVDVGYTTPKDTRSRNQ